MTTELYFTDKLYTANAVCLICMFADPVWFKMKSRLGCSKLTTLVKVSLKFQTSVSEKCHYFLLKKYEMILHCKSFSHFFNENISVFGYKVVKHLTS